MKPYVKSFLFMAALTLICSGIIFVIQRIPFIESYRCPCGNKAITSYRFCPDCGESIDEAWCSYYPTCNECKVNGSMNKFCPICGSDDIERDDGFYMKDANPVTRFLHKHVYV